MAREAVMRDHEGNDRLTAVAEILAAGILRLRLRDVRNRLKKKGNRDNSLEVSLDKSVHRLELGEKGRAR